GPSGGVDRVLFPMLNVWTYGLKMVTRCIMSTAPAQRAKARFRQMLLLPCLVLLYVMTPLLQGCDVFVVLYAAGAFSSKKKSSTSTTPPPPDISYSVYVANFGSPTAAGNEAANLNTNGGNPSLATWTPLGQGSATSVWTIPASMNAILVQGPLTQVYNIDAFESLDSKGAVIEVPTLSNVYANSAISSASIPNAAGMVDGLAAVTVTTDPTHIPCLFALFTQSISSVRIRICGSIQAPGDCVWSGHHELGGTDAVVLGNAAATSTGTLYCTFVDTTNNQSFIVPFSAS